MYLLLGGQSLHNFWAIICKNGHCGGLRAALLLESPKHFASPKKKEVVDSLILYSSLP